MKSRVAVWFGLLLCVPSGRAVADEGVPAQAQSEVQAAGSADEEVVSSALVAEQADTANHAIVRERLRQRLRDGGGGGEGVVCQGAEQAKCRARLREQVKECLRDAKAQGAVQSAEDAAALGAGFMMMARAADGDTEEAATAVRAALKKQWKAHEIAAAAGELASMPERASWRKQAMDMVRDCAGDGSCSGAQAQVAVAVMRQAAGRADADAREARRAIQRELSADAKQAKGSAAAGAAERLRSRLQQRLRIQQQGDATGDLTAGTGQQKRNQYRGQMDGEGRRGGGYGGKQSGGTGSGMGPGSGKGAGQSTGGQPSGQQAGQQPGQQAAPTSDSGQQSSGSDTAGAGNQGAQGH